MVFIIYNFTNYLQLLFKNYSTFIHSPMEVHSQSSLLNLHLVSKIHSNIDVSSFTFSSHYFIYSVDSPWLNSFFPSSMAISTTYILRPVISLSRWPVPYEFSKSTKISTMILSSPITPSQINFIISQFLHSTHLILMTQQWTNYLVITFNFSYSSLTSNQLLALSLNLTLLQIF